MFKCYPLNFLFVNIALACLDALLAFIGFFEFFQTMETRPLVPDQKLLARVVLIREEARNMMGGGILDERNNRGELLNKTCSSETWKNFPRDDKKCNARERGDDEEASVGGRSTSGIVGRGSVTGRKLVPVRPGMFLETVTKVLGGIYSGNVSGITAQHLERVHQKTLEVLQEIAF